MCPIFPEDLMLSLEKLTPFLRGLRVVRPKQAETLCREQYRSNITFYH